MQDDRVLSPREQGILHSIVRTYIQTGEPVSSRSIADRRSQTLSPASIRNVMAELADSGYLSQPHTSAGRIPTEKAFRCYARSITTRPLGVVDAERLRAELFGDARQELLRRFEEERAAYDAILRRLTVFCQKGLLEVDQSPEVHMEGASNLVSIDLHLTRERMRDLFRALEEKKRLIELLDRFLEQPPGEVGVHVGLEEAHPAMKELALIGMTFPLPSGMLARVAVLGPMRMHYEKAIAAVLHIARAF